MAIQVLDIQTANDLAELLAEKIASLTPPVAEPVDKVKPLERYISKKTLCDMMEWSKSGLERYTRKGTVKAYRIDGQIRFKLSEIEQLVEAGAVDYDIAPSFEPKPFTEFKKVG